MKKLLLFMIVVLIFGACSSPDENQLVTANSSGVDYPALNLDLKGIYAEGLIRNPFNGDKTISEIGPSEEGSVKCWLGSATHNLRVAIWWQGGQWNIGTLQFSHSTGRWSVYDCWDSGGSAWADYWCRNY